MRPVVESGRAPLSNKIVQEMLNLHIPYRIRMLCEALPRTPAQCDSDSQAFEAGVVSGRILLGFLGIGYDEKTKQLKKERNHRKNGEGLTDDVKVRDVGGKYVELATLSSEDSQTLCRFIHGANKACAHFTVGSDHKLNVPTFQQTVPIVIRLLGECLPTKTGSSKVD